jgi:hypothetical protein
MRAGQDNFLAQVVESLDINIDISEVYIGTLSKAFKLSKRTRLKVCRALSFNKTPSKLKRAVPILITSPFGSKHSIQAALQLDSMKLGNCTNINVSIIKNNNNKRVFNALSNSIIGNP